MNGISLKKLLYIDSNLFIYALEGQSPFTQAAKQLISGLDQSFLGASSVITYGEVLRPVTVSGTATLATSFLDSLPGLQFFPVDQDIARQAGRLRLDHKLRLGDAVHVATALACRADRFVTNDLPLAKKIRPLIPVETLASS